MTTADGRRQTGDDAKLPTIGECLLRAGELKSVSDSVRLDTEILLAKAVDKPRTFLYTWADKPLTEQQQHRFTQWFERRLTGEPIAYIVGEKEFWSLTLKVNSATLIPRPETELLVETVLEKLPGTTQAKQKVLDLGTGTGAIALALAKERPQWDILAVDKSPAAVELAIENCRALGFTNVAINRSDWFANVGEHDFDAIVCNPPYIDKSDPHLQQGDVRFEPKSALVAETGGLSALSLVIGGAAKHLQPEGWLLVEHGWNQGENVRTLFQESGFHNIETKKDLSGNDRVTSGQLEYGLD